jgi:transcriptional regulator with XRE-family HTH domain
MGRLAETIKNAITASGITRYSLAEQTGTSEAILSRFMSGKQGLSLETLERLADVLGFELIQSVQRVKNIEKGAGVSETREARALAEAAKYGIKGIGNQLAYGAAKDGAERNFSIRRGVYLMNSDRVSVRSAFMIVHYNNNPYAEKLKREREISAIRAWLKTNEIKEVGFSYYPLGDKDKDKHYSFAMILDYGNEALVRQKLSEIYMKSINAEF